MKPNITELIVNQDKCIGCGVCDAICPVNVLDMQFNIIGMYEPKESEGCLVKCTLCIDVCPFVETNKTEKELAKELYSKQENILFHQDLGYYASTHEVHKKEINDRLQSASGGAGHAVLKALLELKKVDRIITVEPNDDSDKLFKFSVFKTSDELQKTRGSIYYPTELSEVLDFIISNDGTYALTVLPCFAKAIRLAQEKNHKLRKRIKLIIGLVCGQMKTKEFTHELARSALGTDRLSSVKYRVKQPSEPASNFAFEFISKENGSVGRLSWTAQLDGPAKLWGSRAFTPMACNNCTDVFAHCADLVLMDAWLPEYSKDYRGHTLVISRSKEITDFLEKLSDIQLHPITAKKVLLSQQAVVDNKNAVALGTKNFFLSQTTKMRLIIQQLTLQDYENNKDEIRYLYQKIEKLNKIKGTLMLPKRIVSKIYRMLKGTR